MLAWGPNWSNNQQMRFEAFDQGGFIEFELPHLPYSGWVQLRCRLSGDPDGAIVSIRINDLEIDSKIDLYSNRPTLKTIVSQNPLFLSSSEIPRIRFVASGQNPDSDGMVIGIDTLEWICGEQTPASLDVLGPFSLEADSEQMVPYSLKGEDEIPLQLGFTSSSEPRSASLTIRPDKNSGIFDLGSILSSKKMETGTCFLTWKIEVEQAGIYRFQIEPADAVPILFRDESGTMTMQKYGCLINNIVLFGKEILRFDPEKQSLLPTPYRIPFQKGENRLSWLIQCDSRTRIRPCLYGLQPIKK